MRKPITYDEKLKAEEREAKREAVLILVTAPLWLPLMYLTVVMILI